MAKPDFMVMVPDLYRRRRRRQARRRVPRHPPDPQEHLKIVFCPDIIYLVKLPNKYVVDKHFLEVFHIKAYYFRHIIYQYVPH